MPSDPYASHLPALRALSDVVPMRRVLEFGMGKYSTKFFMGQTEHLVSVESDPQWAKAFLRELNDFDLVFIDDGKTAEERVETIRWALGQKHPPVVIHDAEVPEYRKLIERHDHTVFDAFTPQTAVVW